MSAFKLIVLKGEKIFYSKNPEKNSEKKKKNMQKHIYANAFICVGRYSAPPKAQINCNRTNLCIKKKGTQWMKDIGRIRGSQASTLFVVLKCYLLNF